MKEKSRTRRIFFALWPDNQVRWALAEVQRSLPISGRLEKPANMHVTLAFIGNVETEQMEAMAQAARELIRELDSASFSATFDTLGYFRRPQILWLGSSRDCKPLNFLQQSLSDALALRGYEKEAREFRPHVTLARRARPLPGQVSHQKVPPIYWQVNDFVLVESQLTNEGSRYHILETYELR